MGKKRNLIIRYFFHDNQRKNESICKICTSVFVGTHVTNLRRHMVTKHNKTYQQSINEYEESDDTSISK